MKREIKCRFWLEGEWHYKTMFGTIPPEWEPEIDYSSVCEFTGLKDKNGKEIYEGDILKNEIGDISVVQYTDENYGGKWGFGIVNPEDNRERNYYYGTTDYDFYESEVIGNVYENQELL